MEFQQTCLPDKSIYRSAFAAGWAKYLAQFANDENRAAARYLGGPVALARLILEHGGECRQVAVAACLAGPAVFAEAPADGLDKRLVEFSREVRSLPSSPACNLDSDASSLSGDARLFLQASAIMLLEQLTEATEKAQQSLARIYTEALDLYSIARGGQDTYRLDTRFEIAVMKATTVMDAQQHIWSRVHKSAAAVHA